MNTIISRQETVKRDLRNKTLHEWMCCEAEQIVRHNWTDIAIHDRKLIGKMRAGETRLWGIYELGSIFLPLYCRMSEKVKQETHEYELSSVEVFMMRFFQETPIGELQADFMRSTKFYFITKGSSDYDYNVVPTTFLDVVDLVFCGKANRFLK